MATTTNYGWTTPDDTALVSQGAAAIRTLGSSIDTTTKNLNPSTTLGDIEYRSSTANTNTRLGIGSTGQVLTVSGGVPAWSTPVSGGMTLLSTTTLSGNTTSISSISQDYNQLLFILSNITPDVASALTITLNSLSTSIYGQVFNSKTGTTTALGNQNNAASWEMSVNATTLRNSDTTLDGYIVFTDYTNTGKRKSGFYNLTYIGTGNAICSKFGSLSFADNGAISSITFALAAGSNFSLGTVKTYGVK